MARILWTERGADVMAAKCSGARERIEARMRSRLVSLLWLARTMRTLGRSETADWAERAADKVIDDLVRLRGHGRMEG